MAAPPKTGELLVQARLIDEQQLETALGYQQARGGKIGEILVSLNYVTEEELLGALATKLSLQILPEAELLVQAVPPETRAALPRFLVEEELIFPLSYDKAQGQLTIVSHEPLDEATIEGIRIFAGVPQVTTRLTTKAAMRKLLARHLAREPGVAAPGLAPRLVEPPAEPAPRPPEPPPPPVTPAAAEAPGTPLDDLVFETQKIAEEAAAAVEATGWGESGPAPEAKVIPLRAEAAPAPAPAAPPEPSPAAEAPIEPAPPPEAPTVADAEPVAESDVIAVEEAVAPPPPPGAAARPRRVLIVDADAAFRIAVSAALTQEGNEVAHVASASEIGDGVYDELLVRDTTSPETRSALERARRENPFLEVRTLPALGPALRGHTVDPSRQFQFFFDLWDMTLQAFGEPLATERRWARARADLARALAQDQELPAKSLDEIYLGAYFWGLDAELPRLGFSHPGGSPMQALLERTRCPFDLSDFVAGPPSGIPAAGTASERVRLAAAAASYLVSRPEPGASITQIIGGLGWAYDSPELAGALLRTLARRGEIALPIAHEGREILVVDTDSRAAGILWLRFAAEGATVRAFQDGAAALDYLQHHGAALVLSEVDLPAMTGIELCSAVKGDPQTRGVKFFFVSREAEPTIIARGLAAGAEDYLIKPVNIELLLIKAKRAIGT